MVYTNLLNQVRVGVRNANRVSAVTSSLLLDSYSGAAAAYSLRKLSSTYTGSAIRVRRSSDNTELNIGFDSDGNLDTYALSVFVGVGNGFVSTWYDQSGNGRNAIQSTAANQPQIVTGGVINTYNTKPCVKFDGNGDFIESPYVAGTSNEFYFVTQTTDNQFIFPRGNVGMGFIAEQGSVNSVISFYAGTPPQLYVNSVLSTPSNRSAVYNLLNGYKLSLHKGANISSSFGYLRFGNYNPPSGSYDFNGNLFEWIIYPTLQSSQSSIESNINSYYTIYPNPTSVWNLLAAAYNADTKAISSLNTSLYAVYNGESNVNDSKGTNNGTAVGGLTYTTGKIGNAFLFNGTNSQIDFAANTMNVGDTFSVSFWAYMVNNGSGGQTILSNFVQTNGGLNNYGWFIRATNGIFYFQRFIGTTVSFDLTATANNINAWQHLTFTRTNGSTKIYLNGVLVAQDTNTQTTQYINTILPRIGSREQTGVWRLANGTRIDAVNIWNKELTQSEVTELYNSGNGAQYIGDSFYKPTVNDALNTYNGTAQGGLTYDVGKVGTAYQFNGTNAYVALPNNSFNFTGDFSVSCWFKTNTVSGNQMIFSNLAYNGGARKGFYIALSSNTIGCWLVNQPTYSQEFYTSPAVSINTWYHLSVTRESGVVKIYLNGALLATDTNGIPLSYVTTLTSIGAYTNGVSTTSYFNGNMDAFNVWNRVLTQSEITELYNSGNGKQYPN